MLLGSCSTKVLFSMALRYGWAPHCACGATLAVNHSCGGFPIMKSETYQKDSSLKCAMMCKQSCRRLPQKSYRSEVQMPTMVLDWISLPVVSGGGGGRHGRCQGF